MANKVLKEVRQTGNTHGDLRIFIRMLPLGERSMLRHLRLLRR